MAHRKITLEMTSAEEAALAALLGWVCFRIRDPDAGPVPNLPAGSFEQIGRLNLALNGDR